MERQGAVETCARRRWVGREGRGEGHSATRQQVVGQGGGGQLPELAGAFEVLRKRFACQHLAGGMQSPPGTMKLSHVCLGVLWFWWGCVVGVWVCW